MKNRDRKKYNISARLDESNFNSLRDELVLGGALGINHTTGKMGEKLAMALASSNRRVVNLNSILESSAFADLVVPIDELGALRNAVEIAFKDTVTIRQASLPNINVRNFQETISRLGAVILEGNQDNEFINGFKGKILSGGDDIYKRILRNPSKFVFYSVKCTGKLTPKGAQVDPLNNSNIKDNTELALYSGIKAARQWYFNTDEFKSELRELPDDDRLSSVMERKVNYEENITGLNLGLISVGAAKQDRVAGVSHVRYAMGHNMVNLENGSPLPQKISASSTFFAQIGTTAGWQTFGEAYGENEKAVVNSKIDSIRAIQKKLAKNAHLLSVDQLTQIETLVNSLIAG